MGSWFSLILPEISGEERIIGEDAQRRQVVDNCSLEPQTELLLNAQVHIKGTSNFKASSQPVSCPPKLQSGNTNDREVCQKKSSISESCSGPEFRKNEERMKLSK